MPEVTLKQPSVQQDILQENTLTGQGEVADASLYGFFGVDPTQASKQQREKIAFISQWLEMQDENPTQRMMILKDLRFRLASPKLGQTTLEQMHQYIQLKSAAQENEQWAKSLEV